MHLSFFLKKKKLKIIEWYICRDREMKNNFKNKLYIILHYKTVVYSHA